MKDKKILQEEVMSDEELEHVAGGNIGETVKDGRILYDYGLMDTWYSIGGMIIGWKSKSAEVDAAWAKAGITCCTVPFDNNKYWHDGKQISRDEAIQIVKSKFKKIHSV